ncbi:hypothetical protein NA57DRAFT_61190 [Rhizodiscina lignyota]|uniref:Uncharacterized protein n=1 Tax=Rhizodiscina lignyota TaxID=1504668 RepID=A0A9P4I7S5_9PEZI|nr:hypothetical protein NA57DRAFT_61190 [Rhizodiscina lignyota]
MANLLSLPAEMRLEIIRYVVGPGFARVGHVPNRLPNIARVCRQLRNETLQDLYLHWIPHLHLVRGFYAANTILSNWNAWQANTAPHLLSRLKRVFVTLVAHGQEQYNFELRLYSASLHVRLSSHSSIAPASWGALAPGFVAAAAAPANSWDGNTLIALANAVIAARGAMRASPIAPPNRGARGGSSINLTFQGDQASGGVRVRARVRGGHLSAMEEAEEVLGTPQGQAVPFMDIIRRAAGH